MSSTQLELDVSPTAVPLEDWLEDHVPASPAITAESFDEEDVDDLISRVLSEAGEDEAASERAASEDVPRSEAGTRSERASERPRADARSGTELTTSHRTLAAWTWRHKTRSATRPLTSASLARTIGGLGVQDAPSDHWTALAGLRGSGFHRTTLSGHGGFSADRWTALAGLRGVSDDRWTALTGLRGGSGFQRTLSGHGGFSADRWTVLAGLRGVSASERSLGASAVERRPSRASEQIQERASVPEEQAGGLGETRYPNLFNALREGRVAVGHGLPDPQKRRLRLVGPTEELAESDQISFGLSGDSPADHARRPSRG